MGDATTDAEIVDILRDVGLDAAQPQEPAGVPTEPVLTMADAVAELEREYDGCIKIARAAQADGDTDITVYWDCRASVAQRHVEMLTRTGRYAGLPPIPRSKP